MVSSSRPNLRPSTGRFARKDSSPEPAAHRVKVSPPTRTRSNNIPLRARLSLKQSTKENRIETTDLEKLGASTRKATRSHPQVDGTPAARPPTRVTVAQPHGGLLETVNGVRSRLNITHDDLSSKAPTPRPESINGVTSVNGRPSEARALRSKDGGSRIKSELAIYFGNYDDVINDTPRTPGTPCLFVFALRRSCYLPLQIWSRSMSPS